MQSNGLGATREGVGVVRGALNMLIEVEDITQLKLAVSSRKGGSVVEVPEADRDRLLREYHCGSLDAQYTEAGRRAVLARHERFERMRVRTGKWRKSARSKMVLLRQDNGMVNTGIDNIMNRWSALSLTGANAAPGFIGVENDNTAVTATTAFLHGASGGTATTTIILAFSPTISYTRPTLTAGATFVNASFTSGVFIINKVGWLSTSTDAGTGLIDVIGGSGGTDPYSRTFQVNFVSVGTFTLIPQIAFTAITVKGSFPTPL